MIEVIQKEHTTKKYYKFKGINSWINLSEEEKKEFIKTEKPTGKIARDEKEEKIYEQDLEDLDVSDLAVYLNRVK